MLQELWLWMRTLCARSKYVRARHTLHRLAQRVMAVPRSSACHMPFESWVPVQVLKPADKKKTKPLHGGGGRGKTPPIGAERD